MKEEILLALKMGVGLQLATIVLALEFENNGLKSIQKVEAF